MSAARVKKHDTRSRKWNKNSRGVNKYLGSHKHALASVLQIKSSGRHKVAETWTREGVTKELESIVEQLRFIERGSAPSRDLSGYDCGSTKDSLWEGVRSRQVPDGLSRKAGGGNDGGEKKPRGNNGSGGKWRRR